MAIGSTLFGETGGKIVQLLRRGPRTVNELAGALRLTDNAIRSHLARLEGDGQVEQVGARASFRKPEFVYRLTVKAEQAFAKAQGPVLAALLDVLREQLAPDRLAESLHEVGRRLAAPHLPALTDLSTRERAKRTIGILRGLGGLAELGGQDDRIEIRGFACPLDGAVRDHPELCLAAQAFVSELVGQPMKEQCDKGERPKCAFVVCRPL